MDKNLIDYFIKETNKRFDKIDESIADLKKFKFIWTGGIVGVNAFISLIIAVAAIYFGSKL